MRRASACGALVLALCGTAQASDEPPHSADLDAAIVREARRHGVPEDLVRRVVMRESRYNPRARNHSFWGLMQISYPTARSMGFRGTPQDLLNPAVNLTYAVPYLANAFIVAGKREDAAIRLYASGYYATARRRGLVGLLRTADSAPVIPDPTPIVTAAVAAPARGLLDLFGAAPAAPAPPQPDQAGGAQLAYAEPPASAPAATAVAMVGTVAQARPIRTASKGSTRPVSARSQDRAAPTDGVEMVADGSNAFEPPQRWRRDGGVSVMAKGLQAADATAFVRGGAVPYAASSGHRRGHKTTEFAALEPIGTEGAAPQQVAAQVQPVASGSTLVAAEAASVSAPPPAPEPSAARDAKTKHAHARRRSPSRTTVAAAQQQQASAAQ